MEKGEAPIYEIYVMSEPWHLDEKGWPCCGIKERVGFYYERETAIRAIEENWCDLQDHYAQAAEICMVKPGLYSSPAYNKYWYYLWNQKEERFEIARKPKFEGWGCDY